MSPIIVLYTDKCWRAARNRRQDRPVVSPKKITLFPNSETFGNVCISIIFQLIIFVEEKKNNNFLYII